MPDRDRLIELITKEVPRPKADALAYHLLANGVIVPVRCKDCKYYTPIKQQSTKWKGKTFYCTRNANMKMNENDFCSCAKLKELRECDH